MHTARRFAPAVPKACNYLDGSAIGKGGQPYRYRCGLCMEPQKFPDSPNHPAFPTCTLRPGERYASRTVYRFSVE